MQATLGSPSVARTWRRAHFEGRRPPDAGYCGLSHQVHALPGLADLYGRPPPSTPVGAPHLERLFHRGMDRQHAQGDHHAFERWLSAARGPANQRHVHDDGLHHPAWRDADDRHRDRRSHLSGRAVHSIDDLQDRRDGHHQLGNMQRVDVR